MLNNSLIEQMIMLMKTPKMSSTSPQYLRVSSVLEMIGSSQPRNENTVGCSTLINYRMEAYIDHSKTIEFDNP